MKKYTKTRKKDTNKTNMSKLTVNPICKRKNKTKSKSKSTAKSTTVRELPFILEKAKALQKKIDSSRRDTPSSVEVKGTGENPQIVITCSAATYEWIKEEFSRYVDSTNIAATYNKDQVGAQISITNKTSDTRTGKSYTINFYNSTSRLLVNGGRQEVDLFMMHYENMIHNLPSEEIASIDTQIREQCESAIIGLQQNNHQSQTSSHQETTSSNKSISECKNPDQLMITEEPIQIPSKSSSDLHQSSEGIAGEPRTCCEKNVCRACLSKDKKIDQLFQLVQSLQSEINSMKNCFQQQQDQVIRSMREELQEFARFVDDTVYQRGESSTRRVIEHLNNQKTNQPCDHYRSYSAVTKEKIPDTNEMDFTPLPNSSSTLTNNTNPTNLTNPNKSNSKSRDAGNRQRQRNVVGQVKWQPENCIIVSVNKTSTLYNNYDQNGQDIIRREINKNIKHTVIERITKYTWHKNPRVMIQLQSRSEAEFLSKEWRSDLFGGSTARVSIDPKSINVNTAMLRGVPIDGNEMDILADIQSIYKDVEMERIMKSGKKMRVIKVKFSSEEDYNKALRNPIFLHSQHIKCNFVKVIQNE